MRFPRPLVRATLLRRYKRFLADVRLDDGTEHVAHVPNPGSMLGLSEPGSEIWLLPAEQGSPRRLAYTLELVRSGPGLVGVNTGRPNALAEEAIRDGRIPALAGYATLRREVRYGTNSRIDILLEDPGKAPCHVEIKNVHLKRASGGAGPAEFPDCVTARGAKHLAELGRVAASGGRAVMLYVVQRGDCDSFRLAADLDPGYSAAFRAARDAGVEALCHSCIIGRDLLELAGALPIEE